MLSHLAHPLRHVAALVVAFIVSVGATAAPASALLSTLLPPPPPTVKVIVQQWDGADPAPRALTVLLGGTVTADLPVVNGFAASIRADKVAALAGSVGVRFVSPDAPVYAQDVPSDGGPKSVYGKVLGVGATHSNGYTGSGVGVAIIDTGVTAVPQLAGRLATINTPAGPSSCVNLSNEPGCNDSVGHGTFIAGLVNAVAPDANLIALKLSGRDGANNVSRLLQALGWVIANKDAYGIEVVNLSLRTPSPLSYRIDPVNLAVERAWAAGLTVVVSAGNQGPGAATMAKPGDDPWVITVGSTDDRGTAGLGDDAVAGFSSRGPTVPDGIAKPDLAVPGKSLISLRSPGSEADLKHPNFTDESHRRGSGTSFSAGLVSGSAAVLAGADPTATNDRIKYALVAAGRAINGAGQLEVGSGTFDLEQARLAPAGLANQDLFHPVFFPERPASFEDVEGSVYEDDWLAAAAEGWNWQGWNWQGWNWQDWSWEGWNWQGWNWQGSNWQGWNWQEVSTEGWNWQGWNWQGWNWQGWNWQGWNWQGWNWQGEYWS